MAGNNGLKIGLGIGVKRFCRCVRILSLNTVPFRDIRSHTQLSHRHSHNQRCSGVQVRLLHITSLIPAGYCIQSDTPALKLLQLVINPHRGAIFKEGTFSISHLFYFYFYFYFYYFLIIQINQKSIGSSHQSHQHDSPCKQVHSRGTP